MSNERAISRRTVLAAGAAVPAAAMMPGEIKARMPAISPGAGPFTDLYDIDRSIVSLDAAYYGAMTRATRALYRENTEWVNSHHSVFLRSALPGLSRDERLQPATDAAATLIGASPDEIALCAGGTEALYGLIVNYAPLKAGDAIAMADVDYDEMQYAMEHLAVTRDAKLKRITMPEPSTTATILETYERLFRETPRLKLLLLTHVSNRNGLTMPVREIATMAKARGIDIILDAAQSVGLLPVDVETMGVDFMGFSLHKWLAAPLGTGAIYIREERKADIAPWLGNRIRDPDDIRARVPTGTIDFAARLTVPQAVAQHHDLGPERKLAYLRGLRDRWVAGIQDIPGLEIVQPDDRDRYAVIGAFRLPGQKNLEQAKRVQSLFAKRHRVLVVAKAGLASGAVMRVTPALFNTEDDLDRLVAAIQAERSMFA
ncbi:aminotransferase class V-fold PLP-dependent enzyme [Qipengyuania qiaonensis]|uniref:Aminotransferase class V-fold PLP-dependent enzyme n=1 Tax=Qipengyuania qiaonensis TaxID=2867240 RepID=A0ABS7JBI8_9SPHN|nr:aminotransferase class V-fold PLP-dependent enzyme [Qipengyuania qiaonensis]MBX7483330.1 aminotransferase class V-fold PLP-dependent enzyme [Qipengyuania qiaonensis]